MSAKRAINPNRGFRIHLDTLEHSELLPSFAEAHAGTPLQHSRWYPNDPDLLDRETRVVKTLDDLLTLMQSGEHARLADSVVLMGSSKPMGWKEFFVRGDKNEGMERFKDLYNRVGKIKGADPIPCAMLFIASETKTLRHFGEQWIKGQKMTIDGRSIDFELYFSYLKAHNVQDITIQKGQRILVTGMAERSYAGAHHETVRVYVDHENAARWVKLEELTTPPPPEQPIPAPTFDPDQMGRLD